MNKTLFIVLSAFFCIVETECLSAQNTGIKTNIIHWAVAGSFNGGLEFALGRRTSLEFTGGYNPFTFQSHKKAKHWLIEPELRLWTCETFDGHFFGVHCLASQFNIGGFDIPVGRLSGLKDFRYAGYAFGGGLSYGYQWILGPRWNFEINLGGGYAYLMYKKFNYDADEVKPVPNQKEHYFGITKAALSLIYFIN